MTSQFFILTKRLFSSTSIKYHSNVEVRTRFAPSPTGNIHLGGLRAALYNYIFAKQNGGKFILRIEDTDQTRIVPGSSESIEAHIRWAGLNPDESPLNGGPYGPYLQSARLPLYQQRARELLDSGKAYKCFCSPLRLDLLRKYQMRNRERPRYDGKCRHLTAAEMDEKAQENDGRYVIRFAMEPKMTSFDDLIFGRINNDFAENIESDPVILKSDLYPTYHFANVVDDHEMKISHVLRGSEWISSTCKHVQIYDAFNWTPPKFAHLPLITMKDGTKMSKRNNQSQLSFWIDAGYRPTAILNFLTNMGGGVPKEKQDSMELWNLKVLVDNFNFNNISCHPGSIDLNKLNIYNSKDIQATWEENPTKIMQEFKELLESKQISTDLTDEALNNVLKLYIDRIVTLNDLLLAENAFIWSHPELNCSLQMYHEKGLDLKKIVENVITLVEGYGVDKNLLDPKLKELSVIYNVDWSSLMRLLRKLLTNSDVGLPVYEIFNCLGKERLLEYLKRGLNYVN